MRRLSSLLNVRGLDVPYVVDLSNEKIPKRDIELK